jgi:hypothetical protein
MTASCALLRLADQAQDEVAFPLDQDPCAFAADPLQADRPPGTDSAADMDIEGTVVATTGNIGCSCDDQRVFQLADTGLRPGGDFSALLHVLPRDVLLAFIGVLLLPVSQQP